MVSVKLLETNVEIGKGQDYYTLNAVRVLSETYGYVYYMCFEFSPEEVLKFLETSRLWYARITGDLPPSQNYPEGRVTPFQPLDVSIDNPLENKADDLLAKSVLPSELLAFVKIYFEERKRNPEHMDVLQDHRVFLTDKLRTLAAALPNYDDEAKPKVLKEISKVSLRLSRLHELINNQNKD